MSSWMDPFQAHHDLLTARAALRAEELITERPPTPGTDYIVTEDGKVTVSYGYAYRAGAGRHVVEALRTLIGRMVRR